MPDFWDQFPPYIPPNAGQPYQRPQLGPQPGTNPAATGSPAGPAPPGAPNPVAVAQEQAAGSAKSSNDILNGALAARDTLSKIQDLREMIDSAPPGAIGPIEGTHAYQTTRYWLGRLTGDQQAINTKAANDQLHAGAADVAQAKMKEMYTTLPARANIQELIKEEVAKIGDPTTISAAHWKANLDDARMRSYQKIQDAYNAGRINPNDPQWQAVFPQVKTQQQALSLGRGAGFRAPDGSLQWNPNSPGALERQKKALGMPSP